MKTFCTTIAIAIIVGLTGCGDKNKPTVSSQPSQKQEDKVPVLPAMASHLNEYQTIDYGKQIHFNEFMSYRELFMKIAASDTNLDSKKFVEMAIIDVGAETDAFKREDLVKQSAETVAKIKKNAINKIFLNDSTEKGFSMAGSISAYDMDTESYTITFGLKSFGIGYGWDDKGRHYDYKFLMDTPSIVWKSTCFECSNAIDILIKIPKDQARDIESKLSSLRGSGKGSASVPAGFYVSVNKVEDSSNWERAAVRVNLDAIALRLPNQPIGTPLILIDGPQLKRK